MTRRIGEDPSSEPAFEFNSHESSSIQILRHFVQRAEFWLTNAELTMHDIIDAPLHRVLGGLLDRLELQILQGVYWDQQYCNTVGIVTQLTVDGNDLEVKEMALPKLRRLLQKYRGRCLDEAEGWQRKTAGRPRSELELDAILVARCRAGARTSYNSYLDPEDVGAYLREMLDELKEPKGRIAFNIFKFLGDQKNWPLRENLHKVAMARTALLIEAFGVLKGWSYRSWEFESTWLLRLRRTIIAARDIDAVYASAVTSFADYSHMAAELQRRAEMDVYQPESEMTDEKDQMAEAGDKSGDGCEDDHERKDSVVNRLMAAVDEET